MTKTKLSLIQRLWLLLIMLVVLSIGGALIANLLNARSYLEQQLTAHSADTANTLALMITEHHADPVMTQTLLNASFEQGNFAEISWVDPQGESRIHLVNSAAQPGGPAWFRHLLPLSVGAGVAQISNGWMQAGHLVVVARPDYAYLALWRGALQTILWLSVIGLAAALLGSFDIHRLRRQLGSVVEQAQAISEQRFVKIPVPGIPELAEVAGAMNHMVDRLKKLLETLQAETEKLRKDILTDALTGLPNRAAFNQAFFDLLEPQDDTFSGFLFLIRIAGLTELNARIGGPKTDALLRYQAEELQARCRRETGWYAARLRGADFALICLDMSQQKAQALAEELCVQWSMYKNMELIDQPGVGHIGLARFDSGDSINMVLNRANRSLALAEAEPLNGWRLDERAAEAIRQSSDLDWKQLIEEICRDHSLRMRWYPVCLPDGTVVWNEGMLYRPQTGTTPPMGALRIVSHALRLGLIHLVDLQALALALAYDGAGRVAVNLSPASLAHETFLSSVLDLLAQHPGRLVNFEFGEYGLDDQLDAFLAFSRAVRADGHQVAVEIAGNDMSLLARVHEAGLAYLVLDSVLTNGIHNDEGRFTLLRGLLKMASLLGVELQAKGVATEEDWRALADSGVHCLTGPAVKPR